MKNEVPEKNEVLFERVKKLVATERRIGVEILECLYEIEKRCAYAELRYDGLFTYCVKELAFTESQAFQRIQAMRALKEVPELRSMIEVGTISVSSVSKVQTHLRKEKKEGRKVSLDERRDLFLSMANRTSREVEVKLAEVRGEVAKEKLVLEMDEELAALWAQAKNLAAHRSRGDASEVLKILAREWIERNDPAVKKVREVTRPVRRAVSGLIKLAPENLRAPPAPLRRAIWKRDGGVCTRCGSRHALEIDHMKPFALGGKTTPENLRLLCRSCNQFHALKVFGRLRFPKNNILSGEKTNEGDRRDAKTDSKQPEIFNRSGIALHVC